MPLYDYTRVIPLPACLRAESVIVTCRSGYLFNEALLRLKHGTVPRRCRHIGLLSGILDLRSGLSSEAAAATWVTA